MRRPLHEDRQRRFIDAAVEVITREGAAKATTRRVASAANAPLGSLHKAFRYKEDLFNSVIDEILDLVENEFRRAVEPNSGLEAAVDRLFELNYDWAREEPNFHVAEYELQFWALRRSSSRHFAHRIYERWFSVIRRILAESVGQPDDPDSYLDVLARDVVAGIDGMVLQVVTLGDRGPSRADMKRYAEASMISLVGSK